jgi:hypothetical protein
MPLLQAQSVLVYTKADRKVSLVPREIVDGKQRRNACSLLVTLTHVECRTKKGTGQGRTCRSGSMEHGSGHQSPHLDFGLHRDPASDRMQPTRRRQLLHDADPVQLGREAYDMETFAWAGAGICCRRASFNIARGLFAAQLLRTMGIDRRSFACVRLAMIPRSTQCPAVSLRSQRSRVPD